MESHSDYPPAPVLMLSKSIDVFCSSTTRLFQCQDWRDVFSPSLLERTGLSYQLGDVSASFPETLSYARFLETSDNESSFWSSVCSFAFGTPSTDLSVVTTRLSLVVLLVLVFLLRACKSVLLPYFSKLGRRAGRETHGVEWEVRNEERIVKFGEYVFRLLFHAAVSVFGIVYFWDKEWWDPRRGGTENLFRNYPNDPVEVGMTWYYLVQCAYNLEALVSLAELSFTVQWQSPVQKSGAIVSPITIGWSKTVRGDFREMAIHHLVTNMLVIGSSFFRLTRIGSMVFLVHDISDIPVDLSKLANFLKWKKATIAGFTSMCLLWLIFRLGVLPFCIYRSILYETWMVTKNIEFVYYHVYKPFFVCLVGQIILLHILWFGMFLKMGWLLVKKGERHDLSEHKAGETQDAIPTTKNRSDETRNNIGGDAGLEANGNAGLNDVTTNGVGVDDNHRNGHATRTNGSSKKHS